MSDAAPVLEGHCALCRRPLGARRFVSQGRLGVYVECEWCFLGIARPVEPELLTDTFTPPERGDLDEILDRLAMMGEA